jgi:hypothetical protein
MKNQADLVPEETLAIEELYIQLRAMKKIMEEKGIFSEDDFRVAYAREVQLTPGEQANQRLTTHLADHRKKFLHP